ncbi:MAG: class I SAM-dependent methyltransferase [Bacillota bacterium]
MEDIYRDFSAFYDLYVGDKLDDLPLYLEYAAKTEGALLEVGAGSGRLTIPLARAGHELVAVDVSPSMLALLRAKLAREAEEVRRRVAIIEADVCRLALGRSFGLVFLPFYTFNYLLTPAAQQTALRNLRGHLAADGRLLIDVFLPRKLLTECPPAPVLRREAVDPATGRPVRCLVAYRFDRGRQLEFRRHIFEIAGEDGNLIRREFATTRRYFFPAEIEAPLPRSRPGGGGRLRRLRQGARAGRRGAIHLRAPTGRGSVK